MTIADSRNARPDGPSIGAFKNSLQKIRTGRANPALLNGAGRVLRLLRAAEPGGHVSLIDSRTISVQPWKRAWRQDRKGVAKVTGLNPRRWAT